jgi:hypothetical protein
MATESCTRTDCAIWCCPRRPRAATIPVVPWCRRRSRTAAATGHGQHQPSPPTPRGAPHSDDPPFCLSPFAGPHNQRRQSPRAFGAMQQDRLLVVAPVAAVADNRATVAEPGDHRPVTPRRQRRSCYAPWSSAGRSRRRGQPEPAPPGTAGSTSSPDTTSIPIYSVTEPTRSGPVGTRPHQPTGLRCHDPRPARHDDGQRQADTKRTRTGSPQRHNRTGLAQRAPRRYPG